MEVIFDCSIAVFKQAIRSNCGVELTPDIGGMKGAILALLTSLGVDSITSSSTGNIKNKKKWHAQIKPNHASRCDGDNNIKFDLELWFDDMRMEDSSVSSAVDAENMQKARQWFIDSIKKVQKELRIIVT